MKILITEWNGRVAPVFDSCGRCIVYDTDSDAQTVYLLPVNSLSEKTGYISSLHIDLIICGAASKDGEEMLNESGVEILSFASGEVQEIIANIRRRSLDTRMFAMPGCRCPKHKHRNRRRNCKKILREADYAK